MAETTEKMRVAKKGERKVNSMVATMVEMKDSETVGKRDLNSVQLKVE